MPHPDDFAFLQECGCRLCDGSLGIQKMPEGYHLMLDGDQMYFFWMERLTGRQSVTHWNKWAIYRGARLDAQNGGSNDAAE